MSHATLHVLNIRLEGYHSRVQTVSIVSRLYILDEAGVRRECQDKYVVKHDVLSPMAPSKRRTGYCIAESPSQSGAAHPLNFQLRPRRLIGLILR